MGRGRLANRHTKLQASPPVQKTRQKLRIFDLTVLDISLIGHKRTHPFKLRLQTTFGDFVSRRIPITRKLNQPHPIILMIILKYLASWWAVDHRGGRRSLSIAIENCFRIITIVI